jgi:hypothetical protein
MSKRCSAWNRNGKRCGAWAARRKVRSAFGSRTGCTNGSQARAQGRHFDRSQTPLQWRRRRLPVMFAMHSPTRSSRFAPARWIRGPQTQWVRSHEFVLSRHPEGGEWSGEPLTIYFPSLNCRRRRGLQAAAAFNRGRMIIKKEGQYVPRHAEDSAARLPRTRESAKSGG